MTEQALIVRIERLETSNRRLQWRFRALLLTIATIFGAGVLTAASEIVRVDTLHVRQLVLEDVSGRVAGSWTANRDGSVLQQFFDANGTERVRLGVLEDGTARHRMFGESGLVGYSASVFPMDIASGTVGIALYDQTKGGGALFSAGHRYDEEGRPLPEIGLYSYLTGEPAYINRLNFHGEPTQLLYDRNHSKNVQIGFNAGEPYWSLSDGGAIRVHAGLWEGEAQFVMLDTEGNRRHRTSVGTVGVMQEAYDRHGAELLAQGIDGEGTVRNYSKKTPSQELGELAGYAGTALSVIQMLGRNTDAQD